MISEIQALNNLTRRSDEDKHVELLWSYQGKVLQRAEGFRRGLLIPRKLDGKGSDMLRCLERVELKLGHDAEG